ncbi:DUF4296 domain-containing protein [Thalassobellus suaedae]|uniref:DUF4296 domain-containing protein n=1 Tax=Thalassobellus suaedae TaxID=3074124 RepID=A0ABY9XQZ4_9FLAO|nr:DUF4296 domain-containing protein [Flavobacteriaceae bacterium HL-DH14]
MILKRFILGFGILLLATACYEFKKPEKPENLISKDKMVDVLIDIKLLTSANNKYRKILKDSGINHNTYVFEKHHIDSLQFALSNEYYAFHIKEYQEIYEKIKDSLERLKKIYKDLELKEEKEKIVKDSLEALMKVKALDSIKNIKIKDSLKLIMKKDTLTEILLKKKIKEEGQLISPVSSTDSQSQ